MQWRPTRHATRRRPRLGPSAARSRPWKSDLACRFRIASAIRPRRRCKAGSESRRCASASMARDLGRLVAGFSTATLNHPPHSFTSFRSPQRGPEGAADWECDLERARHDRRCSGATSGRPLAERCGGRLAIPRPASWPEPPRVADTRTRVPERSARAGQGAASPRRPPGPWGWGLGVGASRPSTGLLWPNGGRSA
jgi:hypothetical protein